MSVPEVPASALERPPTTGQKLGAAFRRLPPSRPAWEDAGFTIVLMALALLGLRTVFFGPGWIVAAVVGVLVGLVITHMTSTWRWPSLVTAVILLLLYLLVVGPNVVRYKLVAGFLPSGTTIGELWHQMIGGWKEFLTSLTPVDAQGPVLALPLLLGLVGTALCYGIARALKQPAAALVAPLVVLGVVIALGTTNPASTLLQGAVLGLVALTWLALRTNRNRPALQNGAGRVTRAVVGAALLVLALAGGLLLGPRISGDEAAASEARNVWRTGLVPPYDVQQFPSPLAGFRRYTEPNPARLFDRKLLAVTGLPTGTPVRLAALDSYDGYVWGAGARAALGDDAAGATFRRIGSHLNASGTGTPVTARVTVPAEGYKDVWLPSVGTVTALEFAGPRRDQLAQDLRFNVDTNTGILPGGLAAGDEYTMTAYPPQSSPRPETLPDEVDVESGGGIVDHPSMSVFDARIDEWAGKEPDQWQKIRKIAAQLRQGAYTDGGKPGSRERYFLPGHGTKRMTEFVRLKQLAGDDEQYASAFALMVNRIGTPARVVLGVVPERDGTVKGRDVHAWVEVLRTDGQWQTLPYQSFVPDRNRPPNDVKPKTQQELKGVTAPPPAANNPPSVLQGPDQAQTDANLPKPKPKDQRKVLDPSTWPDWLRYLVFYVVLPLLVLLLVYGSIRGAKWVRRARRRSSGDTPRRVSRGWREVLDTARDMRVPLPETGTRHEQAVELVGAAAAPVPDPRGGGRSGAQATRTGTAVFPALADAADAHVFSAAEPSEDDVRAYWADVRTARRELRQRVGLVRRVRGDLSLRTFSKKYRDPEARRARRGPRRGKA